MKRKALAGPRLVSRSTEGYAAFDEARAAHDDTRSAVPKTPRQNGPGRLASLSLKDWVHELGEVGHIINEWKLEIYRDLGGEEHISAMQRALVDSAAMKYVLRLSTEAYLFRPQSKLINKRSRSFYPIIEQYIKLSDSFVRDLKLLGLEKRAKAVPSLSDYLHSKSDNR